MALHCQASDPGSILGGGGKKFCPFFKIFFFAFHNQKCEKQKCWKVKFTSNEKVTIKELMSFSKITIQKIPIKISSSKVDIRINSSAMQNTM